MIAWRALIGSVSAGAVGSLVGRLAGRAISASITREITKGFLVGFVESTDFAIVDAIVQHQQRQEAPHDKGSKETRRPRAH